MAVRFSGDNQWYERALSLGSVSTFTVTCWVKLVANRNIYSGVWALDNSNQSDLYILSTDQNGTTMHVVYEGGPLDADTNITIGTWYFFGVAISGASGRRTWRTDASSTFTTSTWSGGPPNTTMTRLRIGADSYHDWINGSVAALKIWNGVALSQTELEAEALTYPPTRTSGILAWYPFNNGPETTDYGPNGYTLSGGASTASDANPTTPTFPATTPDFQGWGVSI